jgi:hypothetical protein
VPELRKESSRGVTAAVVGSTKDANDDDNDDDDDNQQKESRAMEDVYSSVSRLQSVHSLVRKARRDASTKHREKKAWEKHLRSLGVTPKRVDTTDTEAVGVGLEPVLSTAAAKQILSECPCAHPTYAPTLASVVMDPTSDGGGRIRGGTMHVRFGVQCPSPVLNSKGVIADSALRGWVEIPVCEASAAVPSCDLNGKLS